MKGLKHIPATDVKVVERRIYANPLFCQNKKDFPPQHMDMACVLAQKSEN